jgi:RNA polymerase-binding protein DksA
MECAATRRVPISYLGDAMAERTKTKRRAAPAAEITTTASGGAKAAGTKTAASKPTGTRAKAAKPATSKSAKSTASKSGGTTAAKKPTATKPVRSAAETERIRAALAARRDELREEYDVHLVEIAELQRDRLNDSAGDDPADTGSKTFEREQEISLAHSILERTTQVERALERLDEGNYGWCERCGNAIPVERLAAFPSATLCVACKQLEERR